MLSLRLFPSSRPLFYSLTRTYHRHHHHPINNKMSELRVEGNAVVEVDEQGRTVADRGEYVRVQAGYKAAAHNPALTEETRQEAESHLQDLQAQHDDETGDSSSSSRTKPAGSSSSRKSGGGRASDEYRDDNDTGSSSHEEKVHHSRVVGGLKANLHRDDRSEETKEQIRQKLSDMGEDAE